MNPEVNPCLLMATATITATGVIKSNLTQQANPVAMRTVMLRRLG